jgi:glyoxylase-like metal-dependent hydrolase (beta-lactamase superfamily II)
MTSDIRLYAFEGGSITLPLRNFRLGEGGDGDMITTPVIWFLLTHPRGNVIIDGGNAAEAAVDAKAHWGAITEHSTLTMTPDQAVVPSLERLGVDPESIRWIVQSHLHQDHTGAVAAVDRFPNAQVLVTETEHAWAHAPDAFTSMGYCLADFAKPGVNWALLDPTDDGYDLFGDGTLRCWRTPGHSAGHQSIEIHLPSGDAYMLTVDAANSLDHYDGKALPGFMLDAGETLRSVSKLRRLAWRAQATPIAGHDPVQFPTLRHAPEYYS